MPPRRTAAGPWGGVVLRETRKRIAKGWPSGLTTLNGEDLYHLDRALGEILGSLVEDPSDPFAVTILRDGRIAPAELVGMARSRGMFASRRVVVVRDPGILDGDPEPLSAFAERPPDGGFVLVRAPKLDRKRKLHQALLAGTSLEFRPPADEREGDELRDELSSMAQERGVRLARDGAIHLALASEHDLARASTELDKIRDAFAGRTTPLGAAELSEVVPAAESMTGWELGDHLLVRDRALALATARRYADSGEEAIRVVGGLAWRARALVQAKAMEAERAPFDRIVQQVRAWAWRDPLRRALEAWTLPEALALPSRLLAADRALKSRQIGAGAVLESLVRDLTEPR